MRIDRNEIAYIARAIDLIDAGEIDLTNCNSCNECDQSFNARDQFASRESSIAIDAHSFIIRDDRVIIIIACEGYHQLRDQIARIDSH